MSKANLSNFAAFDLDDLLTEISTQHKTKKEVTGYLDRSFLINLIKKHQEELILNKPDFSDVKLIDVSDFNFTGADFRNIKRKEFEIFNFQDCDITAVHLDRVGIEFFKEYIIENRVINQGINLQSAYLGPVLTRRIELGIECLLTLNLSNMNLAGSDFQKANLKDLILDNTNISGCNFIGAKNLDVRQFINCLGFETALFHADKPTNLKIKEKIEYYINNPDKVETYSEKYSEQIQKIKKSLADLTNVLDD